MLQSVAVVVQVLLTIRLADAEHVPSRIVICAAGQRFQFVEQHHFFQTVFDFVVLGLGVLLKELVCACVEEKQEQNDSECEH